MVRIEAIRAHIQKKQISMIYRLAPAPNVKSLRVPAAARAFPADCPHDRWIFTAGENADEYQTVLEEFPAYGSVLLRLAKFLTLGPL